MIGVILAGGKGTRLRPITYLLNKHLINIYDKPMIYYPLSLMLLLGIKKIYIVTNKKDIPKFQKIIPSKMLKKNLITFVVQDQPKGILDGLKKCSKFFKKNDILLMLGDNFIYGSFLISNLKKIFNKNKKTSQALTFMTDSPQKYGIFFEDKNKVIEKPKKLSFGLAVLGIYYLKNNVLNNLSKLKKSKNGEYEISSLLNLLLREKKINFNNLSRSILWWDCGTFQDLHEASLFVSNMQKNNKNKIADLNEILKKNDTF